MTYPPEPWDLRGAAVVSVWWRRGPVCTAFVDYQPDGVMAYHELLVARPTRHGVTIPSIWVDSPASRAGGRDLWAIPKDLADFDGPHTALGIARVRFRAPRWGVPVVLPGRTWQPVAGGAVRARLRASAAVAPVRVAWEFDPDGPLAWLRGRSPLISFAARGLRLRFGPRLDR